MSTTYTHVQLSNVDKNGNVQVMYPQNTAKVVSVDRSANTNIPSSVNTAQDLANKLEMPAFLEASNFVFIDEHTDDPLSPMNSEINDNVVDPMYTWSSKKITDILVDVSDSYSEDRPNLVFLNTTEDVQEGMIRSEIDDDLMSSTTAWSSEKIADEIDKYSHIDHNSYIDLGNVVNETSAAVINNPVRYPRTIAITAKKEDNESVGFPLPNVNFHTTDEDIYWYIEYVPTAYDPINERVISAYEKYVGFTYITEGVHEGLECFTRIRAYVYGSTESGWTPITTT